MNTRRKNEPGCCTTISARRDERAVDTRRATGAARRRTRQYVEDGDRGQRSRCGPIARRSRGLVKYPGLGAGTPVAFVRHSWPVSRRGDSSQIITFHHSRGPPPPPRIRHFDTTLRFSPAGPSARPLAAPGSSGYPIQINAIRATPTARGGAFTHPTEFDTFRHFSTHFDISVEFCRIAHSGRCFRLMFALDMGCILKMGKGLFEIGFVPKKHFLRTADYEVGCSENDAK